MRMKKQLIAVVLLAAPCVSMTAYATTQSPAATEPPETSTQSEKPTLDTSAAPDTTVAEEPTVVEETIIVDTTPVIAVGESATTDICEFVIDYVNITNDAMPPNPGSWYSHYEAEAGKVYVDFCVAYKNTATSNVDADKTVSGKLIYADEYNITTPYHQVLLLILDPN